MEIKKIVIIGPGDSIYTKGFCENVKQSNLDITLITNKTSCGEYYAEKEINIIEVEDLWWYDPKMKLIGDQLEQDYVKKKGAPDICIIHYSHFATVSSFHKIWMRANKRILVFWGSDFYMLPQKREKMMLKFSLEATCLVFVIPELKKAFLKKFSPFFFIKGKVVDFGMNLYDEINEIRDEFTKDDCKEFFNIPLERKVIHIGYNGTERQNHIEVLRVISRLDENLKQKLFIVIPFQYYPSTDYLQNIKDELKKTNIQGMIVDEVFDAKKTVIFRKSADIFLYNQETDAGSQSVIEYALLGAKIVMPNRLLRNYSLFKKSRFRLYSYGDASDILSFFKKGFCGESDIELLDAYINENLSWKAIITRWQKILGI